MSRGSEETARLRRNVEEQLGRLLEQLADLDEFAPELAEAERDEMRQDTLEALEEMKANLDKMTSGNMTLVSEFGRLQLAIQAAVSSAFKTPEVLRLFSQKNSGQLRARLAAVVRDERLGKLQGDAAEALKVELLAALRSLGDTLSPEEAGFLDQRLSVNMSAFEGAAAAPIASNTQDRLLRAASSSVKKAQS